MGAVIQARHVPVMVDEVLEALRVNPGSVYIDCTVGEGGHALSVLEAVSPAPGILGVDLDEESLNIARERLNGYGQRARFVKGNFAGLGAICSQHGIPAAAGVLFDLGVSSLQLETAGRGFSFSREGRLDMRFDTSQELTAYDLVNKGGERELVDLLREFGEENRPGRLARAVLRARPIETTLELAEVIARASAPSRRSRTHPATRTFQALRISVNRELDNVRLGLEQAVQALRSGGRLVVISYHSLEDRLVKTFMRREGAVCICPAGTPECICGHRPTLRVISKRVKRPSPSEVRENPRSRSARMRIAERL